MTLTKAVILAHARNPGHTCHPARPQRSVLPPAPLLPLANRCLLRHAVGWLARAGIRDAAVIVPQELAARAREATVDSTGILSLRWHEQRPDESLAQTLSHLTGFLAGEPFVLHLADSLARQSLRSLTAGRAEGDTEALLAIDESPGDELAQVVQLRPGATARRTHSRPMGNDAAGVAVMSARALEAALDSDLDPNYVLEGLTERIQRRGGRVCTRGVTEWWRFRGGADALLEGNRFALEGWRADYDGAEVVDSEIQGAVVIHPDAQVKSSVVRGPAIVGARARLCDAYVGPYTSIGDDVVIEGAEIEHSVALPGAWISHLGVRLEASVIGPSSRVLRDFRLPRAVRLTVGEGAEVVLT